MSDVPDHITDHLNAQREWQSAADRPLTRDEHNAALAAERARVLEIVEYWWTSFGDHKGLTMETLKALVEGDS